jgi:hypothetical protein
MSDLGIVRGIASNDGLIINSRVITNFAGPKSILTEYPNDINDIHIFKNGNMIWMRKIQGLLVNITIKLMINSDDDKFLNSLFKSSQQNPNIFSPINMQHIKNTTNENGNLLQAIVDIPWAMFQKLPSMQDDSEGDVEQAISTWGFIGKAKEGRTII